MESSSESLMEMLGRIPDPRSAQGKRHPLTALLGLAAVGLLAGMKSLEAIAQFGRDHGKPLAEALGFRRHKTPCKATFSNLFRQLDKELFEQTLRDWIAGRTDPLEEHIIIDGKTLRGSKDGEVPGVHLLSAYLPESGAVLAQLKVAGTTNEHKVALKLLGILPLSGRVVTADAIFTQRDLCQQILDQGGDYILIAKDNQQTLKRDIQQVFGPDGAFSPLHPEGA